MTLGNDGVAVRERTLGLGEAALGLGEAALGLGKAALGLGQAGLRIEQGLSCFSELIVGVGEERFVLVQDDPYRLAVEFGRAQRGILRCSRMERLNPNKKWIRDCGERPLRPFPVAMIAQPGP